MTEQSGAGVEGGRSIGGCLERGGARAAARRADRRAVLRARVLIAVDDTLLHRVGRKIACFF
jgi:hypothetical protein